MTQIYSNLFRQREFMSSFLKCVSTSATAYVHAVPSAPDSSNHSLNYLFSQNFKLTHILLYRTFVSMSDFPQDLERQTIF